MAEAVQGQAAPAAADPIAMIQAQLDAEVSPPEVEKPPEGEGGQGAQVEGEAVPESEAEPETNTQVEGEDAPTRKVAEIPLEQLEAIQLEVTTKGEDGKDVVEKPTIKELREGYMRQKDYHRKTTDVARQRDEVGAKVRQGIEAERTQYAQSLQQAHDLVLELVAPELKDVNWNKLAVDDPFEYVRVRNRADQITQAFNAIQAKQKEVKTKTDAEQAQAIQQAAQQSREVLEKDIPGWNDQLYSELMKAGSDFGYKPEEVGKWVDPRALKLLHAANEFRKLKAGKPPADKKVVVAPKVIKPGAAADASQAQQRNTEAMKRLQTSHRVEDAAAVIRSRL